MSKRFLSFFSRNHFSLFPRLVSKALPGSCLDLYSLSTSIPPFSFFYSSLSLSLTLSRRPLRITDIQVHTTIFCIDLVLFAWHKSSKRLPLSLCLGSFHRFLFFVFWNEEEKKGFNLSFFLSFLSHCVCSRTIGCLMQKWRLLSLR